MTKSTNQSAMDAYVERQTKKLAICLREMLDDSLAALERACPIEKPTGLELEEANKQIKTSGLAVAALMVMEREEISSVLLLNDSKHFIATGRIDMAGLHPAAKDSRKVVDQLIGMRDGECRCDNCKARRAEAESGSFNAQVAAEILEEMNYEGLK